MLRLFYTNTWKRTEYPSDHVVTHKKIHPPQLTKIWLCICLFFLGHNTSAYLASSQFGEDTTYHLSRLYRRMGQNDICISIWFQLYTKNPSRSVFALSSYKRLNKPIQNSFWQIKLVPTSRESLVGAAGDGKIANLFLQCLLNSQYFLSTKSCAVELKCDPCMHNTPSSERTRIHALWGVKNRDLPSWHCHGGLALHGVLPS